MAHRPASAAPVREPARHPTPAPSLCESSPAPPHQGTPDSPRTASSSSAPAAPYLPRQTPPPSHRAVGDIAAHFPSPPPSDKRLHPASARSVPPKWQSRVSRAAVPPPPSLATAAPAEPRHPRSKTPPAPSLPPTNSALASPDHRLPSAHADPPATFHTT